MGSRVAGPPPPTLTDTQRAALQEQTDDVTMQTSLDNATDSATAQSIRNRYITTRLLLIDANFLTHRRTLDAASDGTVLGLGVLGTLRDSTQAQANLAALVTGLKSNIDKNYYDNRATDAIASTMVTQRKEILLRIIEATTIARRLRPCTPARWAAGAAASAHAPCCAPTCPRTSPMRTLPPPFNGSPPACPKTSAYPSSTCRKWPWAYTPRPSTRRLRRPTYAQPRWAPSLPPWASG